MSSKAIEVQNNNIEISKPKHQDIRTLGLKDQDEFEKQEVNFPRHRKCLTSNFYPNLTLIPFDKLDQIAMAFLSS